MVSALEFDWTIDLTGLATALLAAGTVWLGFATRRAARATELEARLARDQLNESQRPVLVPAEVPPDRLTWRPLGSAQRSVLIGVRNVGAGPALEPAAVLRSDIGTEEDAQSNAAPVAPGGVHLVAFSTEQWEWSLAATARGRVIWTYRDLGGSNWVSVCALSPDGSWGRVRVDRLGDVADLDSL